MKRTRRTREEWIALGRMRAYIASPYGALTKEEARGLLAEAQNHRCCYCGVTVTEDWGDKYAPPSAATLEHLQQKAQRGPDTWDNLVVACFRCNGMRQNGMPPTAHYLFVWAYHRHKAFRHGAPSRVFRARALRDLAIKAQAEGVETVDQWSRILQDFFAAWKPDPQAGLSRTQRMQAFVDAWAPSPFRTKPKYDLKITPEGVRWVDRQLST